MAFIRENKKGLVQSICLCRAIDSCAFVQKLDIETNFLNHQLNPLALLGAAKPEKP